MLDFAESLHSQIKLFALKLKLFSAGMRSKEFKSDFKVFTTEVLKVCCRYEAMCIHGDKKQEERDWVLKEFRWIFILAVPLFT